MKKIGFVGGPGIEKISLLREVIKMRKPTDN